MAKVSQKEKATIIRNQIIASEEFLKWYDARRHIQPYPSDPYRAYMIDKSLRARYYDEPSWLDYVNRSDLIPVDNVKSSVTPSEPPTHRTHRKPSFVPASKKRPQHDKEPLMRHIEAFKKGFLEHFNLAPAEIIIERREGEGMAYAPYSKTVLIPESYYKAVIQSGKKRHFQQLIASTGHELGHHAFYSYGGGGSTDPFRKVLSDVAVQSTRSTRTLTNEKFAWNAVRKFVEDVKPMQLPKWGKSASIRQHYAFGTYLMHTPKPMTGSNPKLVRDFNTNLLLKPEEALNFNSIFPVKQRTSKRRAKKQKRLKH